MKKKLIFLLITVLCFTLLSAFVPKSTAAMSVSSENQIIKTSDQTANDHTSIRFKNNISLQYVSTEIIDYSSGKNKNTIKSIAISSIETPYTRYIFKDDNSNTYFFDQQNRLVHYTSQNLYNPISNKAFSTLIESDISKILEEYLKSCIENYNDFEITGISDMGEWYNISMKRAISTELYDYISINLSKSGEIDSLSVKYCNLKSISDTQKEQLKAQLDDYMNNNKVTGATTNILSARYEKINDKIIAIYTIEYSYRSNNPSINPSEGKECEFYIFSIPA